MLSEYIPPAHEIASILYLLAKHEVRTVRHAVGAHGDVPQASPTSRVLNDTTRT